jgi:glutathione gamma-glutamylcysteinyltransferase
MVLNALQMDPGRTWKLPWRWYAEDMLDCCVSLDSIRKEGITLAQFFCLSKCNGLDVKGRYGTEVTLDEFEADVQRACSEAGTMMVASFDRATFRSTGNGHFSPIAGYNPNRRMVLILDTARFKHSAHWAPIDLLYKAMFPVDPKTGQSRGYALLRKSERPSIQCLAGGCKSPEYLFQMNCERHDVAPRAITAFLCDGLPQLAQRLFDSELLQSDSLNHFLGLLVDHAPSDLISVLNVQHSCNSEKFAALIGEIRDLQLYAHVRYTVSQLYASAPLFEVARRDHMDVDACAIVLTTVLLAASVDAAAMNEVGAWARLTELRNEVEQRSAALRAEVSRLQQYFVALAKLHAAEQSALRSEAR